MDSKQEILDAIEIMIDGKLKQSAVIYDGVVSSIGTLKKCSVVINGDSYTVKYYGTSPSVGTVYPVFIPFNNWNKAFILVP